MQNRITIYLSFCYRVGQGAEKDKKKESLLFGRDLPSRYNLGIHEENSNRRLGLTGQQIISILSQPSLDERKETYTFFNKGAAELELELSRLRTKTYYQEAVTDIKVTK